ARERRGRGRATPGAGAVSAAAGGGGGGGGPGERRALVVPAGRTHLRRRLPRSVRPAGRGAPGTSAVTAARRTTGPRGGRPSSGRHPPGPARLRTPSGPSPSAFRPSRPSCLPSSASPPTVERDVVTAPEAPLSAPPAPMSRRQILQAMSGLMAGMFVAILAGTVVANALPTIITDLNASQSAYTWVVTSELLAMTATVPLWGKLSDLFDKKLLLQLSLGLFVVGSLLAGFSTGIELLILSRVIQGIGAGGLTALAQVVMAAIIPPRELGKYAGIFGAVFAVGTVAGPLVGGALVDTSWLGWRWCFFIGVPFALLAIVLLQRTLRLPTIRREAKIDFLGAFLIVAGVSALLIWVSLAGNDFDWVSWQTAALTGAGVVLLGAAVFVESRAPEPV